MSKTEYSRLLLKRATFPGVTPTIPTGSTISNDWLPTDLLEGELFLNSADDRLWVRTSTGIKEISISGISTGNYYTTSTLISGTTVYFNRTDTPLAYSFDAAQILSAYTATDIYTTGATLVGTTLVFDRNDALSAYTADLSALAVDLNTFVTGFTYNNANTLTISNNNGTDYSATINTMTGLTVNGNLFTETLEFDTTYTGATSVGQMNWDPDFGVPEVGLVGGNVVAKLGESVYAYVKNVDTTTLNKGEVVYIFGASGDKISVKRASATGDTTSSKTLGVVAESIDVNQLGYVITQGTLDGLNLGSYTAGDIVWLSTTPGQFTNVKQYAPTHLVFVGVVQRANAGNGQLYVKPQNGYELDELHNVAATGATNGDLLVYSGGTTNLWVNSKTLTGAYTINGDLTVTGVTYLNQIGNTGDCVTDLYVSNIHSCSPLNINPLNEGNVYFGSTSGVTIDVANSRLGIGKTNPQYPLDILGSGSTLYYDINSAGGNLILSGNTRLPRITVVNSPYLSNPSTGGSFGMRAWDDTLSPGYGKPGDLHIYAGNETNGLNIINRQGSGVDDYIRFYAGQDANGTIPDIHIQGSGTTRGFVGIGTNTPISKLDVNGKTKTTTLQVTSGAVNGYVLTSDANGNATWQATSTGITPTLAQVLTQGNTTSGNNIIVSTGDKIYGDNLILSGGTTLLNKTENSVISQQATIQTSANSGVIDINTSIPELPIIGYASSTQSFTQSATTGTGTGFEIDITFDSNGDYVSHNITQQGVNYITNEVITTNDPGSGSLSITVFANNARVLSEATDGNTNGYLELNLNSAQIGTTDYINNTQAGVGVNGTVISLQTSTSTNLEEFHLEPLQTYITSTDISNNDTGSVQIIPKSILLIGEDGVTSNEGQLKVESNTSWLYQYDGSTLQNVSSIQLDNISSDGSIFLFGLGTTTNLTQDSLLLDPLNGSYLKSQSTTGLTYTELSFNDIKSKLESTDGTISSTIELDPFETNLGSYWLASNGTWTSKLSLDPSESFDQTGLETTDGTNINTIRVNQGGVTISTGDGINGIDLSIQPTSATITGGVLEYAADYSGNYTNRSLVDKEYVDNNSGGSTGATAGSFGITIDGGGTAITTGVKGYITIPYNGTITGWDIFADTTGSTVIDVWKDTYANFPPTVADTIAGTEKPTLTSAVKNQDTNLTSWTTSVTAGDIIAFNVDSAATVTRVNLIIYITKS